MIITSIDTETTGLEWGDHRFIEVYIEHFELHDQTTVAHKLWRIHPQRTIQPAAQAVHKISLMDLAGCPAWEDVAKDIHAFLHCGDLLVAHNGEGFDFPFLNYEFKRVGLPEIGKPVFDTMIHGRWATPVGKVPNLGELCWACEIDYDSSKAHAADYDVAVMTKCFFKGVEWGFYSPPLPERLAEAA
jgi:DNA polymerase III subunit epsilon